MAAPRHYWDAPTVPALTPPTATVVVRSRCGLRLSLPAWQVNEWSASADNRPHENDCSTCVQAPGRLDVRV